MNPKKIITTGLIILFSGFIFDINFINIPPQDAPPELVQERESLYQIAKWIYYVGMGMFILGLILLGVKKIKH